MKTLALVGAAVAAFVSLPALAADGFDGKWSVQMKTESGSCDRAVSATLGVQGGRISESGLLMSANGSVDQSGRVHIRVSGAGHVVAASGKLAASAGSGTWVSSSHGCTGRWVASRI